MAKILEIRSLAGCIVIETDISSPDGLSVVCWEMNRRYHAANTTPVAHEAGRGSRGAALSVERTRDGKDGIYMQYAVLKCGRRLPGPCRVTRMEASAWDYPYPKAEGIKGLQVHGIADAVALGVRHAAINLSQPTVMLPGPGPDALPFESNGRAYYFRKSYIHKFDAYVRMLSENGIIVNLILLNSMKWDGIAAGTEMERVLAHPDYDREGFISAFNTVTPEGIAHYIAFIEFVASRYMREDAQYGRACGLIVGNEVDSQWVWGNAGRKTAAQYVREYAVALRLAWLAAAKYYAHARAYVSLDHFWTMRYMPDDPLKTYGGREVLELLAGDCRRHGDFPWALAHHPYPEDLNNPDFWHDKTAEYCLETGRITFKNLEVLDVWLRLPRMLHRGAPRPVILSEQGFNSKETDESEQLQRAAYCLAYQKALEIPLIEAFILHAHVDNRDEFGLNLGLWRRDKHSDEASRPLSPKPIYEAFRDIDGPDGAQIIEQAREFIGADVWDAALQTKEIG